MSIEHYRTLIAQLRSSMQLPDLPGLSQSTVLSFEGTEFTLMHGGLLVPDSVLLYCDFGELPAANRERILLRLLESNLYLFGQHAPAFTYQAHTNHIMLTCRFALRQADLVSTTELLQFFAGIAARWRRDHFLFD